jgi:hypothetical protein
MSSQFGRIGMGVNNGEQEAHQHVHLTVNEADFPLNSATSSSSSIALPH